MHLTGLRGMPRRVYTYPADIGWDWLNLISTMGAVVLGIGMFAVVVDVTLHRRQQAARRAEPLECRHAGMDQRAGRELGRPLDPARREPLSALGAARTSPAR